MKLSSKMTRSQQEINWLTIPIVYPNDPRTTSLILAVRLKYHGVVIRLLQYGAGVSEVDEIGQTALDHAVNMNDVEFVFILVLHDFPLEITDNVSFPPLALALWRNDIQMVRYLVANVAVVYARRGIYQIPSLSVAAFFGHLDIIQFLLTVGEADRLRKGMKMHYALYMACDGGYIEAVKYLIDITPLELAIARDHEDIASLLLSHAIRDGDH
nr:hypothetical transcript [Hymenolepis microstoma]